MNIDAYLKRAHPDYRPRHIVHAGAHHGEEAWNYEALEPLCVTWIEADPETFGQLSARLDRDRHGFRAQHRCVQALLSDRDDQMMTLHRFSNEGASSSLFKSLPRLRERWPDVKETGDKLELPSCTMDRALERTFPWGVKVDVLVLDLQGAELDCLKGAERMLENVRFLQCEVSVEPIYDGGVLYGQLDGHLRRLGFVRQTAVPRHGDVIYERFGVDQGTLPDQRSGRLSKAGQVARRLRAGAGLLASRCGRKAFGVPTRRVPSPRDRALILADADECRSDQERRQVLEFAEAFSANCDRSAAQIWQDCWVEHVNSGLRGGFFVEIGAGDGSFLSNSRMLEEQLGWRGLCVEPNPAYAALRTRRRCRTDARCVWRTSGETVTLCVPQNIHLSTIKAYASNDMHADQRKSALEIAVETVTLNDLLLEHEAPAIIDYLSIDTEGSEYEILKGFDFDRYRVRCMTIEHNFTRNEPLLDALLMANGYRRVLRNFSRFDAWYVKDPW